MPDHSIEIPSPRPKQIGWLLPCALAGLGAIGWACENGVGGANGGDGDTDNADDGGDGGPGDGGDDTAGGPVTRRDVLRSIAINVIAPATADFAARTAELRTATAAYEEAQLSGQDATEQRTAATEAWQAAALSWQQLEVMQVGPAAPSLSSVAGEDLRDEIYSWPTADSCSVDRATESQAYTAGDFVSTELVWAYGLDALEYLLFVEDDAHTCPSQIQLDGPWDALGSDEIASRRAAYATVVATDLDTRASELAARWASDGDFADLLSAPGQDGSPYADDNDALNDVFRGMFYVDKQTKDGKLAVPLGIIPGCETVPCTGLMESPFAEASTAALHANLLGLRAMVLGGPDADSGDGFDDLLEELGEGSIGTTLLGQIDAAIAATEGDDTSLQALAASDLDAALALHDAVKAVTDTLKGPFVMALMLQVPAEGAGDND